MHPQITHDSLGAKLRLDVDFFVAYMKDTILEVFIVVLLQVFAIFETCMDTLFKGWLSAPRVVAECKCSFYHGLNNVALTLAMNFVLFFLLFKFFETCKCSICLLDTLFKRWLSAPKEVVECKCGFYYGLNNVAMTLDMKVV
jgi:hypothetical protein